MKESWLTCHKLKDYSAGVEPGALFTPNPLERVSLMQRVTCIYGKEEMLVYELKGLGVRMVMPLT